MISRPSIPALGRHIPSARPPEIDISPPGGSAGPAPRRGPRAQRTAAALLASVLVLAACSGGGTNEPPGAGFQDEPAPARPATEADAVALGRTLHQRLVCDACHSLDGAPLAGPSYLGIYGEPAALTDGGAVLRDDAYLRRAILDPSAEIVAGYGDTMRSYEGALTEDEIAALISLIRSLQPAEGPLTHGAE